MAPARGVGGKGWPHLTGDRHLALPPRKVGLEWEAWHRGGFGFGFFFFLCACLGAGRAGHTPGPGSEGPRGTLQPEGFKVGQGNGTGCSAIEIWAAGLR